jgi:hypothetical protein
METLGVKGSPLPHLRDIGLLTGGFSTWLLTFLFLAATLAGGAPCSWDAYDFPYDNRDAKYASGVPN